MDLLTNKILEPLTAGTFFGLTWFGTYYLLRKWTKTI